MATANQVPLGDRADAYLLAQFPVVSCTEGYYIAGARLILRCMQQRLAAEAEEDPSRLSNTALYRKIYETPQAELCEWLRGTDAEALLAPGRTDSGGFVGALCHAFNRAMQP